MNYEAISDKFVELYGDDLYQEIFETFYNCENEMSLDGNIKILDVHRQNAINAKFYGYFVHNNQEICFEAEDGNNRGSLILSFGENYRGIPEENPFHNESTILTFIPDFSLMEYNVNKQRVFELYDFWTNQNWFKEKERGMNYDFYFDPSNKTKNYYREFASSKKMRIGTLEDLTQLRKPKGVNI